MKVGLRERRAISIVSRTGVVRCISRPSTRGLATCVRWNIANESEIDIAVEDSNATERVDSGMGERDRMPR